jgi:hypothetical protein
MRHALMVVFRQVTPCIGVCRSSTLAEQLANLLAISEAVMCHKARLLDADALPWTPTFTFDKL